MAAQHHDEKDALVSILLYASISSVGMDEHTFLAHQRTHALVMVLLWLHELDYPIRTWSLCNFIQQVGDRVMESYLFLYLFVCLPI